MLVRVGVFRHSDGGGGGEKEGDRELYEKLSLMTGGLERGPCPVTAAQCAAAVAYTAPALVTGTVLT